MLWIAHRGLWGEHYANSQAFLFDAEGEGIPSPIENTCVAFDAALAAGAYGLECDIRMSADHVPVVVHDADLRRTHQHDVRIGKTSAVQLQHYGVPTLAEFLERYAGKAALFIELKEPATAAPVAQQCAQYIHADITIISAIHSALARVKHAAPEMSVGATLLTPTDFLDDIQRYTQCSCLLVEHSLVQQSLIDAAKMPVIPWTVNDEAEQQRLAQLGIDMIIADDRLG